MGCSSFGQLPKFEAGHLNGTCQIVYRQQLKTCWPVRNVTVVQTDGNRIIAVQRTDLDLEKDPRARELAIADNRTADLNLEWDPDVLKDLAGEIDLAVLYGQGIEGNWGLTGPTPEVPDAKIDQAEKLQKVWKVERDQIWSIPSKSAPGGAHRIMCGDSTTEADVAALMGGSRATLMATDPPYGVAYSGRGDSTSQQTIANDDLNPEQLGEFLLAAFRAADMVMLPGCPVYICHADGPHGVRPVFEAKFNAVGWKFSCTIIWAKPVASMGWQDYRAQHEPILYGWKKGDHYDCGDRSLTTLWNIGRDGANSYLHPTQKPVELFERMLTSSAKIGDLCYEPFVGSGPQLCAAERAGRICYGMEIEPKYVAVALQRMADMGLKPELATHPCTIAVPA